MSTDTGRFTPALGAGWSSDRSFFQAVVTTTRRPAR